MSKNYLYQDYKSLTDSTVLRSVGSIFGYINAYQNFKKGLNKLM